MELRFDSAIKPMYIVGIVKMLVAFSELTQFNLYYRPSNLEKYSKPMYIVGIVEMLVAFAIWRSTLSPCNL